MLNAHTSNEVLAETYSDYQEHARHRRIELLTRRLPWRIQQMVRWLRQPSSRWMRIPAGILLIFGGFLSILPIFGLWMLPLGLVLLAEDIPPLRRATNRALAWIEHRRPHWMGLPRPSTAGQWSAGKDDL